MKAPARIEDAAKLYQKMGGKVIGTYMVMGEYDYIAIGEGPSDEMQAAYALALSAQGNVRTGPVLRCNQSESEPPLGSSTFEGGRSSFPRQLASNLFV
jgi:uncharacterized protein with GYD domain